MIDFMKEKMVLFDMGGAEEAIAYGKSEYHWRVGDEDHYDLLEDHVARALREKGIEFAMPHFKEF